MCRNIKTLYNFDPPATEEEIQAAALQYVRKISGFRKPSASNEVSFEIAIGEISQATEKLLASLSTSATKRNREQEAEKVRLKNKQRFG